MSQPQSFELSALVSLPHISAGRRKKALERVAALAAEVPPAAAVAAMIPAVIDLQVKSIDTSILWFRARENEALHDPGAKELHLQVSRANAGVFDALGTLAATGRPEVAAIAADLQATLYPRGLLVNTQVYIDQNEEIERIVNRLDAPELADQRPLLGLDVLVARLRELNQAFGEKLVRPERLTFTAAKAIDREAETGFLSVFVSILGLFHTDDPAHVDARSDLLTPVYDQIAQAAAHRALRRAQNKGEATPAASAVPAAPPEEAELAEDVEDDSASEPPSEPANID